MIALASAAAAVALSAWIIAGYPLLLRWVAGRHARPIRRKPVYPRISVIIPVHNGAAFISAKLRSVLDSGYPRDLMEVIVISDGSTDGTEAAVEQFLKDEVRLLRQPRSGKPAALNAAIAHATGEILLLTDARQKLESGSITRLMENFADPEVGVASGELRIAAGSGAEEASIGLYWRFESWIRDSLSSIDSMFGATGPFYAIRRDLAVPIPQDTLLDDMYLPLSAFRRGYRLIVDTRARAWDIPTNRQTEFQRKVRTLAGNYQILRQCPWLLGFQNRMWFHFVSYKFGRLLLPWCLLVFAVASIGLPQALRVPALVLQGLFYGMAAFDPLIGARSPVKRFTSPARTFVVMMIAVIRGLSVFFVPPRSLWKVTAASAPANATRVERPNG